MANVDAQTLVNYATQPEFLATPYKDHSKIPKWGPGLGWDCSSFTSYVMAKFGVTLPAYSDSQFKLGIPVSRDKLQPGDLIFYHTNPGKVTGHVALYIGGGKVVNALSPSAGTKIVPLDSPGPYVGARRYLSVTGSTVGTGNAPRTPQKPAYAGGLPADLIPGDSSKGVAKYDPLTGALIAPGGQVYFPYTLWVDSVPASVRKYIGIISVPGAYKGAGASKDPGAVQEITPGTVAADTLTSASGLLGWFGANLSRIGLGLLGVGIIIMAVIYANKGTIKETVGTAAKVAAVA